MRRGALAALAVLAVAGGPTIGFRVARDQGAFGCEYVPRDHIVALHLSEQSPRRRVRIGEAVSIDDLGFRSVTTRGAGLAPGTQNGIRGYVWTVTATGNALISGITAEGRHISGRVAAHC
jgi:hypothetical protein